MILTALSANGQSVKPDTTRTYGITELKAIAANAEDCMTCDTLLSLANLRLENREELIKEKDLEIFNLNNQITLHKTIISNQKVEIDGLYKEIDNKNLTIKFLKFGWAGTTVIISASIIYFAGKIISTR